MKKIILSAAFLALAGLTTVQASEVSENKSPMSITVQQDSSTKTPVELKDLPEPVKTALQAEPLKAWTPTAAFLVVNADKSEYYQIDVKKEEETGSIKIDKEGKPVE